MEALKKTFKEIDFFSQSFSFELNDSKIYKTMQGATFSLICFSFTLIIGILFGKEVYQRKSPNVAASKENIDESMIEMNKYPFMLSLFNSLGKNFSNFEDYITTDIYKFTTNPEGVLEMESNFTLVECLDFNFKENGEYAVELVNLAGMRNLCVNASDSTILRNSFPNTDSSMLRYRFSYCLKGTQDNCLADKEFFSQIPVIAIKYINSYLNNLSYTKPVTTILDTYTFQISNGLFKSARFYVNNDIYISDNGWLLEDYKKFKYFYLQSIDTEVDISNTYILQIDISTSNLRNKTQRNYLKVKLFARVGGIANAIFIFMQVLSYNYLRFLYLMFIRENSLNYLNDKKKTQTYTSKYLEVHKKVTKLNPNIKEININTINNYSSDINRIEVNQKSNDIDIIEKAKSYNLDNIKNTNIYQNDDKLIINSNSINKSEINNEERDIENKRMCNYLSISNIRNSNNMSNNISFLNSNNVCTILSKYNIKDIVKINDRNNEEFSINNYRKDDNNEIHRESNNLIKSEDNEIINDISNKKDSMNCFKINYGSKEKKFKRTVPRNNHNHSINNISHLSNNERIKLNFKKLDELFSKNEDFDDIEVIEYKDYLRYIICSFKNSSKITAYKNEISKIKNIFDIKLFNNYIIEEYYYKFKSEICTDI